MVRFYARKEAADVFKHSPLPATFFPDLLRGTSGTSVLLRFRRTDSVPGTPSRPPFSVVKTLRLRRAAIPLPSASLALLFPEHVGLLRLASFTETAGEEVEAALAAASAAGAKALILDLRGNPGGAKYVRNYRTP